MAVFVVATVVGGEVLLDATLAGAYFDSNGAAADGASVAARGMPAAVVDAVAIAAPAADLLYLGDSSQKVEGSELS